MKQTDYITPNENWLIKQFKDIPFGVMRPSEMETIISYFIIYHDNNLEKTEEFLSKKYKISESKAKRLKIEFANRYRANTVNTDDNYTIEDIALIIHGLFLENKAPFEYNEASGNVSFMVSDPWERKIIKQDLEKNLIVFSGDFNGKLIKMSQENFVHYTNLFFENIRKNPKYKHVINKKLTEDDVKKSEYWKALDARKKAAVISKKALDVLSAIISLGTGLADIRKLLVKS